jgi:hypothetical protein
LVSSISGISTPANVTVPRSALADLACGLDHGAALVNLGERIPAREHRAADDAGE